MAKADPATHRASHRPPADTATPRLKKTPTTPVTAPAPADKDAPLKEDIRLLGRMLGDVLREQEGADTFAIVETIRQTAVRFRRDADAEAGAALGSLLKKLSREQTITVVRAFSYFSHLANIAEDQHHNRRRRAHLIPVLQHGLAASRMRSRRCRKPVSARRRCRRFSETRWSRRC